MTPEATWCRSGTLLFFETTIVVPPKRLEELTLEVVADILVQTLRSSCAVVVPELCQLLCRKSRLGVVVP